MGRDCKSDNDCGNMKCLMAEYRVDGFCMCSAYATVAADSYCLDKLDDYGIFYPDCNGWLYFNFFLYSLIQIDFFEWILTSPTW